MNDPQPPEESGPRATERFSEDAGVARATARFDDSRATARFEAGSADTATATQIAGVLDRFLKSPRLVAQLPGHLAVVDPARVRFRPPLRNL